MKRLLPLLLAILFLLSGCKPQSDDGLLSVSETGASASVPTEIDGSTIVFEPTEAPDPIVQTQPAAEHGETPHGEDAISLVTPVRTPVPTPAPTFPPTPVPTPAPFVSLALPDTLRLSRGYSATDLRGVVRRDSDGDLFAYGTIGETEPCFYPCDATGSVVPGERPADAVCAVPTYTPTDKPKQDGILKLVVYIPTQSVVAFRSKDGEWVQERVMICSSGRPGVITPRGEYRIYETYEFKRLGTEGNYCCGLYACRFNGAYLFHSIPISYDAINDPERGHRMVYLHKYEQLGEGASDGCVRLTVADAKWIYDNAELNQTMVLITDNEGPIPPAAPAVLWEQPYTDENGFGWDPTDPHPDNPYLRLYADPSVPLPTPTPAPFVPAALPETLRVRKNYTLIASPSVVRGADGRCYSYGSAGSAEPGFYPCDENGFVAPGAEPAAVECAVPAYTPTDAPGKDGEKLLVVYLGSQCVVGYEGEDGDWKELRVMICSTGRRKHDTPVGNYRITDRYTYKILGTEDTHCYGLWACRFKDHYLFHSVPISYDAGRDSELGHRMCDMHKFEKLGSVASDGCVRLTVADAKWIYELSESQRVNVRVVKDSGPTPVRPPAVIWEEPYTDKNGYGWDPTDPHPLNPYHNPEQP